MLLLVDEVEESELRKSFLLIAVRGEAEDLEEGERGSKGERKERERAVRRVE